MWSVAGNQPGRREVDPCGIALKRANGIMDALAVLDVRRETCSTMASEPLERRILGQQRGNGSLKQSRLPTSASPQPAFCLVRVFNVHLDRMTDICGAASRTALPADDMSARSRYQRLKPARQNPPPSARSPVPGGVRPSADFTCSRTGLPASHRAAGRATARASQGQLEPVVLATPSHRTFCRENPSSCRAGAAPWPLPWATVPARIRPGDAIVEFSSTMAASCRSITDQPSAGTNYSGRFRLAWLMEFSGGRDDAVNRQRRMRRLLFHTVVGKEQRGIYRRHRGLPGHRPAGIGQEKNDHAATSPARSPPGSPVVLHEILDPCGRVVGPLPHQIDILIECVAGATPLKRTPGLP